MERLVPFGKYFLLERINVGGMAEVFLAKAYGAHGFSVQPSRVAAPPFRREGARLADGGRAI